MKQIAPTAVVSPMADLEDSVKGSKLVIGDQCRIDAFVKIKFAGGVGDVIIGSHVYLNSGTVLYSGNGISLGNNVLVAANCTFAPTNHEFRSRTRLIREQGFMPSKGGIIVEDDVWIGANAVILDGARIRKGAVIGAHSLVSGEIDSYGIYLGVPARKNGERLS